MKIVNNDCKKTLLQKHWIDNGTDFAGETTQFCKAEQIQTYSVMSESTATDDKRTVH